MRRTGHNAAIYTVAASLLRFVNKTAKKREKEREVALSTRQTQREPAG